MAAPTQENFKYAQDANGPQAGGYNPTQVEMLHQALQDNINRDKRNFWLQQDQRSQFLSAMVLKNTHGDTAAEAFNSGEGRALRTTIGMVMNSPMLAGFNGGNMLDLYNGVNTGMLNSGMSFASIDGAGAYSYGGTGYMQDTVAKKITQEMQREFFTATGGSRLGRTSGMDRTELGQISAYIGMRGGFSGLDSVGDVRNFSNRKEIEAEMKSLKESGGADSTYMKELESLAGLEQDLGGTAFKLNDAVVKKFTAKIREGTKALSAVKDILGERGIGELADVAESLTGLSITNVENSRTITERFRRIKQFSQANGLNAEAVVGRQIQVGVGLQQLGLSQQASRVLSEDVDTNSQAAFNANRAARNNLIGQGLYVPETTLAETTAINQMDVGAMLKSEPRLAALAYNIENNALMSAEQKTNAYGNLANISSRISPDLSGASQKEALTKEIKAMDEAIVAAGGTSIMDAFASAGGDPSAVIRRVQGRESASAMGAAAYGISQRRLLGNNLDEALRNRAVGTRLQKAGILDEEAPASELYQTLADFRTDTPSDVRQTPINRMMRALRGDSPEAALNKVINESDVSAASKVGLKEYLSSVEGVSMGENGDLVLSGDGPANTLKAIEDGLGERGIGSSVESTERLAKSMMQFDSATSVNRMMRALRGDSPEAALNKVINEADVSDATKARFKESLHSVVGVSMGADGDLSVVGEGAKNALYAINEIAMTREGNPMLNNFLGEETKNKNARALIYNSLKSGSSNYGKTGFLEAISEGLLKGTDITAGMAMEHAVLTGKADSFVNIGNTGEDGLFTDLDESQMDRLAKMSGIGLSDFKEKIKTDPGQAEVITSMKSRGSHLVADKLGDVYAAAYGDETLAESDQALRSAAKLKSYQEVSGKDTAYDWEGDDLSEKGMAQHGADMKAKAENFAERSEDLVKGSYKALIDGNDGWGWSKGNARDLKELQSLSPDTRNSMIDLRMDVAREKGDDERVADLQKLKQQMSTDGNEVSLLTQIRDVLQRMENDN